MKHKVRFSLSGKQREQSTNKPVLILHKLSKSQIEEAAAHVDDEVPEDQVRRGRPSKYSKQLRSRMERGKGKSDDIASGRTLRERAEPVVYTIYDEDDDNERQKRKSKAQKSSRNGSPNDKEDEECSDYSKESDLSVSDDDDDLDILDMATKKHKPKVSNSIMEKREHKLRMEVLQKKKILYDLKLEYWKRKMKKDFGSHRR